jgi:hypothetical protein
MQLMTALYRSGSVADTLACARGYRQIMRRAGPERAAASGDLEIDPRRDVTAAVIHSLEGAAPAAPPHVQTGDVAAAPGLVGREDLAATSELLVSLVLRSSARAEVVRPRCQEPRRLGAPRFRDGVIVCELAALPDDASVLDYVAAQVGLVGEPGADLLRQLAVSLANRRILLLLDNCEHVLASVRALVRGLLGSPGVRILATSREPLAVAEEQLWRVDPLPVANGDAVDAPAVRLFRRRPSIRASCPRRISRNCVGASMVFRSRSSSPPPG